MNTNKLKSITTLVALLLLTGCQQTTNISVSPTPAASSNQQTSQQADSANVVVQPEISQQESSNTPTFEKKNITIEKQLYSVKASYPVTGNDPVDKDLLDTVQKEIDPFVQSVPTDASQVPGPYSLEISFTTSPYSPEIVSFVFDVYTYTGGAHPNSYKVTKTYNIKTGAKIGLSDIFLPDSYLVQLSELSRISLKKALGSDFDADMLNAGTDAQEMNFESFSLEPGSITFYFDPYDVAPYAAGPQHVTFGLSDISINGHLQPTFKAIVPFDAKDLAANTATGFIEGSMGYPSEGIPNDIVVCASTPNDGFTSCSDVRIEDKKYKYGIGYKLEVPVGSYYVYEKFNKGGAGDFTSDYKAYYSEFVTCGESVDCKSHKPISVQVQQGKTAFDIEPTDWYL